MAAFARRESRRHAGLRLGLGRWFVGRAVGRVAVQCDAGGVAGAGPRRSQSQPNAAPRPPAMIARISAVTIGQGAAAPD